MLGAGIVKTAVGLFGGNKLRLLIVAAILVIAGFAFQGKQEEKKRFDFSQRVSEEAIITDAVWGEPREKGETLGLKELAEKIQSRSWGNALMQLGLSFGLAMVLGSLVRAFVKTMVTLIVIVGGLLWFLQHKGIIDPFWQDYYGVAESTKVWALAQFESIKTFMKGSLPSAGAAMVGFGYGLKK